MSSPLTGSFLSFIETPNKEEFTAVNLQALGYTSAFVHLPKGDERVSADIALSVPKVSCPKPSPLAAASTPTSAKRMTLKRFKSLTTLKSFKPKAPKTPSPPKTPISPTRSTKSKSKPKAKKTAYPPPLMNELALLQFADGGSLETNAKRAMHTRAKSQPTGGVGDVHRDGKGGMWVDVDEEMEYAHLLVVSDDDEEVGVIVERELAEGEWVQFGSPGGNVTTLSFPSFSSQNRESTQTSLNSAALILPSDEQDPLLCYSPLLPPTIEDDLETFTTTLTTTALRPVLSRPSRRVKGGKGGFYVVESGAFLSPKSPKTPKSPKSPKSAKSGVQGQRTRRRPAPLDLKPLSPGPRQATSSPLSGGRVMHVKTRARSGSSPVGKRMPERGNVRGLFGA